MKKISKDKIKTWFVTGASSGVGHEMCAQLLNKGYNIVAVARKIPDFNHPNALCLSVDVTKRETIQNAINEAIEKFGKIDVLVNNAGVTSSFVCEEETLEHIKSVFEVNYFGTFNTINLLIPHFRQNKNGTIINNSSMNGISFRSYGSAYCSSKHAIEGLTSVVRHECGNFLRAMAFELGFFGETDIVKNSTYRECQIDEYANLKGYDKLKNYPICKNSLAPAINSIIETVEYELLPRHLLLGHDSIFKGCHEIEILKDSIKYSKIYTKKCSKIIKKENKFLNYFKFYKYRILKNFVFGETKERYSRKQKEYEKRG